MGREKPMLTGWLQALEEPDRRELVAMSLVATASSLRVDRVLIWLFDGEALQFFGDPSLLSVVPTGISPGQGVVGSCFSRGQMVVLDRPSTESWARAALLFDANDVEEPVTGYLAPLRLAGLPVGVLAALRAGEESIHPTDMVGVEVHCLKLTLALHHCAISREICSDWMAVFEEQTGPSEGAHRLDNCPILLAPELPKGIHGPTLKALCKHLHYLGKRVTSKDIATSLGISQVTVGRYLTFMIERRLVRRTVEHRQIGGRPTYLYCAEQRCPQLRL